MTWSNLITALDSTKLPFAHFAWVKNAPELRSDHGVYAEDDELTLYANNARAERVMQGTIDYYTRDDSGAPKGTVEAALDAYKVPYHLNSIQFEEDTGFIHYEWIFEVER